MSEYHDPTENIDRSITVITLHDQHGQDRIDCTTYEEAIQTVKEELIPGGVAKIENREEEVVFTSSEMSIDNWEAEWRKEKRRIGTDVEERNCPYDSIGCFADDLCVRCKMDESQSQP